MYLNVLHLLADLITILFNNTNNMSQQDNHIFTAFYRTELDNIQATYAILNNGLYFLQISQILRNEGEHNSIIKVSNLN